MTRGRVRFPLVNRKDLQSMVPPGRFLGSFFSHIDLWDSIPLATYSRRDLTQEKITWRLVNGWSSALVQALPIRDEGNHSRLFKNFLF